MNYFKKFLIIITVLILANKASAYFEVTPRTETTTQHPLTVSCIDEITREPLNHQIWTYDINGNLLVTAQDCYSGWTFSFADPSLLYFIETDPNVSGCEDITLEGIRNCPAYTYELPYEILQAGTNVPYSFPTGLFFDRDSEYQPTSLLASVADSTQSTFGSVGPIAIPIIGIILTFIFFNYVIGLFYENIRPRTHKYKEKE